MKLLRDLIYNCEGVTSIEYSLIAVLISIFLIAGTTYMGQTMGNSINTAANGMASAR